MTETELLCVFFFFFCLLVLGVVRRRVHTANDVCFFVYFSTIANKYIGNGGGGGMLNASAMHDVNFT